MVLHGASRAEKRHDQAAHIAQLKVALSTDAFGQGSAQKDTAGQAANIFVRCDAKRFAQRGMSEAACPFPPVSG